MDGQLLKKFIIDQQSIKLPLNFIPRNAYAKNINAVLSEGMSYYDVIFNR